MKYRVYRGYGENELQVSEFQLYDDFIDTTSGGAAKQAYNGIEPEEENGLLLQVVDENGNRTYYNFN